MANDQAAVQACLDGFAAAWDRADVRGMAAGYAEDDVLIDPFGNVARGRDQIEALLARTVDGMLTGSRSWSRCARAMGGGRSSTAGPLRSSHRSADRSGAPASGF